MKLKGHDATIRILALCMLTAQSLPQSKQESSIQLPPQTRPALSIAGLDNRKIVCVSETRSKAFAGPTRIFRYSFRGTFLAKVNELQRVLKPKDGWKMTRVDANEFDFWRDLGKGPIAMQGLLVFSAHLVPDKKSPFGWSPLPPDHSQGWIWVSYDERSRADGVKR